MHRQSFILGLEKGPHHNMQIYGIDFTSSPKPNKPIACAEAWLESDILQIQRVHYFTNFPEFMEFLQRSPIWIAGMDFPLGQPRKLIENLRWGETWAEYVSHVGQMTKQDFVETLNQYRQGRAEGDREHLRQTDRLTGAISPMKVYGVPVGKMFFEGAPRMLAAGFSIQPCHPTADPRVVMEVYPAVAARKLIGKYSYKSDTKQKQTSEMQGYRQKILDKLNHLEFDKILENPLAIDFSVDINQTLVEQAIGDASGDTLDAILATVQAASAARKPDFGIPQSCDRLEGWICI